ncbi:MAG: extracellular ligand-binding receptor [Firmicutes bacterium]|nr:extracellular ligand-binding receptor [Bacillota bacterium]
MKFLNSKEIVIVVGICLVSALGALYLKMSLSTPIKIGFSGSLTGVKSEMGVNGRNGTLLAVEDINRQGGIKGRKVELVVADDKHSKKAALEADRYLAGQGVRFIIGHMTSDMAELTVPFADSKGLLLISPTISTEDLTGLDDHFIRIIPSNKVQAGCLAKAATVYAGVNKIVAVYDAENASFAKPIIVAFQENLKRTSGDIILVETYHTQEDFTEILLRIQATDANGILIVASSIDAAMFCQQTKKMGIKKLMFFPMWTMTNDFILAGGTAVEGAYLINQEDLASEVLAYRDFRQRYNKRYGAEPTYSAILSYDAAMVLFEGMNSAPEMSADGIKTAILQKERFQGLQQEIQIDRYGDAVGGYYLYRVRDGVFVKVGPI